MAKTITQAFFAYPSRTPTLKEAIHGAVPELNEKGQVNIRTWEQCNIGGKFVIDTICKAIDEAKLFLADLTGLNANVMFELGYAIACGKRIWLILDDTYTKEKDMFEQLKILTTVGYVTCCNSQDIVSGFEKDKPFVDIQNTIFRAPIEPNLKPYNILYLKSQHENEAALQMSILLQEKFPGKIIVDAPNKLAVQSLVDYGNLVFSCSGLVCHFTNPAREDAYLQTAKHALICGMAHGFEKPLLMLAEGKFPSPIDYRDFLKHYDTAPQALGYLKEWLPRVKQGLKADGDRFAGMRNPLSKPHVEQGLKADQEAAMAPQKIFISYAHQDTEAQKKLKTYLAVMEREGKMRLWDDNEILPGDKWEKNISNNLANSDILLYLVSAQSLTSDNCNKELAEALRSEIRVVPIILDSCDWLNDRLSDFQALPDKGLPINKWQPESDGWQNAVDGIRKVVEGMQAETLPEWVFQQGNFLMMLGQIDRAIEAYSHVIELNPNNAATYYNRGTVYCNKRDYNRAIEDYNRAISLNPKYAETYNNRGLAYYQQADYNRAIEDYTKTIALNPKYAEAYNNRGLAYYQQGDCNCAIEDFTKAIDLNPNYVDAHNNRGAAYIKKGDYDRAIKDFNKAIELIPSDAGAYNNRGLAYAEKGDYDRAIEDYNRAIALNPNNPEVYNNRGLTYNQQGDHNRAIEDLNRAINLKLDYTTAYINRGTVYSDKGEVDRGIKDYIIAIELEPDSAEAYNNCGMAYADKGDYDRAIDDYNMAVTLKSDYAEAYFNRGNAFIKKNNYDRAINDYTEAIRLNPNYAEAYYNRGTTYSDKGEIDRAIDDNNVAVTLKPDYAEAYFNRGNALIKKSNYDRAIDDYTEAIRLNPNYAEAYYNRGAAYGEQGDYDRAIDNFTQVIELNPNYTAEGYYNRGTAHLKKGDFDHAIEDYTKIIEVNSDHYLAYYYRACVWLRLREWEKANSDLTTARGMGINIIASFHSDYGSVANFERVIGIQLPTDITAILTPWQ